jgi:glycosyltransferase involved in cell wall biosynthesis
MKNIFLIFLFDPIFSSNYLNIIGYDLNNKIDTKLLYLRKNQLDTELKNLESILNNLIEKNDQKFFIILIASYNNIEYYEKNIKSVLDQDYQNYIAIYMDDISIDGTADAVEKYLDKHDIDNHFILIKNRIKKYCLKNYIDAINSFCLDNTILVTLDGDDWLCGTNVLTKLNNIFKNNNILMTYGDPIINSSGLLCSEELPWDLSKPLDKKRFKNGLRKELYWPFFHLRSFYTFLFRKINQTDFLDEFGEFFTFGEDVAFMIPMAEMCGFDKIFFIKEPMYVYNDKNPLTSMSIWGSEKISKRFNYIYSKKPYNKIF